jgi:RNA polymerase sigma-70 factor (ECF subfamily)
LRQEALALATGLVCREPFVNPDERGLAQSARFPSGWNGWENMKAKPQAAERRRADFEALHARHGREVWAVAYARWLNADLAQDIMQEAFLRLWKQWQAQDDIVNPRAWLLRVARNLAEDHAKSAFHRNGTQTPATMNGVKGRDPLPLERLEKEETFAHLRVLLKELAPPDREILTLRYALDYNANEIATFLHINTTAVHMRLSRARQRLAERLTAEGVVQQP